MNRYRIRDSDGNFWSSKHNAWIKFNAKRDATTYTKLFGLFQVIVMVMLGDVECYLEKVRK